MRYDLGLAHLEMGLRLHDRAHLERAEAILAEIGAAWDAARAREALEQLGAGQRQEPACPEISRRMADRIVIIEPNALCPPRICYIILGIRFDPLISPL